LGSTMPNQLFVNVMAILGAALLAIVVTLFAHVLPRTRQDVEDRKGRLFDRLGETFANDYRRMLTTNAGLFVGSPTERTWEIIGDFYARAFREYARVGSEITSIERPVLMVRDAGFSLIYAALSFFVAIAISFTQYSEFGYLIGFFGGVFVANFLTKFAILWRSQTE